MSKTVMKCKVAKFTRGFGLEYFPEARFRSSFPCALERMLPSVSETYMNTLLAQINPDLRKVLKDDYFLDVMAFLLTAIKESRVQMNDTLRFRHYYIRTLECHPKATFLSMYSSTMSYKDQRIEKAIADFIRKGGKLKHIIIVRDIQELSLQVLQAKIARLQQIGVEVHYVNGSTLSGDLRKNFLVESYGKIAWEMHVDHEGHVISSTVSTNKQMNACYYHIFEVLREDAPRISGAPR